MKQAMKCLLILVLLSFYPYTHSYPDVRIDNLVSGWKVKGRTSYAGCSSGNFELEFGESFSEYRGACLLTYITAILLKEDEYIRADPYWSSGTAYSQFEIVQQGSRYCVRRVGTNC